MSEQQKCQRCETLEKELKKALKTLAAIEAYADRTAAQAAGQMSAGNVPQGKYAHLRGENQTANIVLSILDRPTHERKKPLFRGIFRSVFK